MSYLTKDCEPNPETISQTMEHVGLSPGVPETVKRTRDR